MENVITYESIEKANTEIKTMKIGTSDYAKTNERVKAFRKVFPTGTIETIITSQTEETVAMKTFVKDCFGNLLSTGSAEENKKNGWVNKTSMLENCETSSVGRALGFAGFGIDNDIATGDDISKISEIKRYEVYDKIYITDKDAQNVIKLSIGELIKKNGIVKESLNDLVLEKLWTTLEELNTTQLKKLETLLRTVNMENNEWHELYGENRLHKKDLVPKGQEIVYKSSMERFREIAVEMAKDDEMKINDINDSYARFGLDV